MKSTGRCARIWKNTAITPLCQSVYRRSMKAANVCRMRRQTGICTTIRKQRWRSWAMSGMRFPNYARPGYACRHNIGYWTGVEYLGLGLGASSLVGGKRFQVTADLNRYLVFTKEELAARAQYEEIHELSRQERMEEFMFLGLRLTGGVRTAEFERRFGVAMEAVYGEVIERLLKEGLLEASIQTDSHIRLTEYGLDVSTYALAEFLQ